MVEVPIVISDDEVIVAGSVNEINLLLDVGPEGDRGAIIFSGVTLPPATPPVALHETWGNISQFRYGDVYIHVGSSSLYWLYQYQILPGGNDWVALVKMNPPTKSFKTRVGLTSGQSSLVSIPLVDIIGSTSTTLSDEEFIIQATINSTGSVAYAVSATSVAVSGSNLEMTFNVRQSASSTFAEATGTVDIDVTISVGSTIGIP